MRSLATVVALSFFALPAFSVQRQVADAEMNQYKSSLAIAFRNLPFECSMGRTEHPVLLSPSSVNSFATSIVIDESGPQPALILSYSGDSARFFLYITTDASHQTVTRIEETRQDLLRVQHGSLVRPNVTNDWVTTATGSCGPKQ